MSGGAEPMEAGRPLHWRARLAASGSGRYLALGFFAAFLSLDAGDHGEKSEKDDSEAGAKLCLAARSRKAKARLQRPGDGGKAQSASEERSHASVPEHSGGREGKNEARRCGG